MINFCHVAFLFFPLSFISEGFTFSLEARGKFYIKFEKSCLSPPTETKMSGKSSEYWTSFPTSSIFTFLTNPFRLNKAGGGAVFPEDFLCGNNWCAAEEELCTDLSCFSRREIGKNKIMGTGVPPCHRQGCTDHITAP